MTSCPLCKKEVSYAGFSKHIFSSFHKNDLVVGLQKRKDYLVKDLKMFPTTGCIPYIRVKSSSYLHLCFGCNKSYYSTSNPNKQHTCPSLAKGLKTVQDILDAPTLVVSKAEEPDPQGPPLPSPVPALAPPPAEVAELKREVKRLQVYLEHAKADEEKAEKGDQLLDALNWTLRYIKNQDCDTYEGLVDNFKDEFEGLLSLVKF